MLPSIRMIIDLNMRHYRDLLRDRSGEAASITNL
jgi:hypothetical protein